MIEPWTQLMPPVTADATGSAEGAVDGAVPVVEVGAFVAPDPLQAATNGDAASARVPTRFEVESIRVPPGSDRSATSLVARTPLADVAMLEPAGEPAVAAWSRPG